MTGNQPADTRPQHLKALQLLTGILMAGIVIFTAICVGINYADSFGGNKLDQQTAGIFSLTAIILAVLLFGVARVSYNKSIKQAANLTGSFTDKLNFYRSLLIKYLALCEGAAIYSVITFFLTGDYRVLLITAFMVLAMATVWPSKKRVVELLQLNWQEEQEL
jgi:hypothetical protein